MFKGKDCSESRSLDFSSLEFEIKTKDNCVISQMAGREVDANLLLDIFPKSGYSEENQDDYFLL